LNVYLTNIQTSLTTYCQGLQKIIGLLNECGMTSVDGAVLFNLWNKFGGNKYVAMQGDQLSGQCVRTRITSMETKTKENN